MIIKCETDKDYHYFVIPEINCIEDLATQYKENKPIDAYVGVGTYMYCTNQLIRERFSKCKLYLDNYLHYRDISKAVEIKSMKDWDEFHCQYCNRCQNQNQYRCWTNDNGNCSNFKPYENILKRISNKLTGK